MSVTEDFKKASVIRRIMALYIDMFFAAVIVCSIGCFDYDYILCINFILTPILMIFKDCFQGRSLGKCLLGIAVRDAYDHSKTPATSKLVLRNIYFLPFISRIFNLPKGCD